MNTPSPKSSRGITLVELMVTIAVLAIVLGMAVPSLMDYFDRARVKGAAEAVYADLRLAQAESVKQNLRVDVTLSTGANWSSKIEVIDKNNVATELMTTSATAYPDATLSSTTTTKLRFMPGRSEVRNAIADTPIADSTIVFASKKGKEARLLINRVGRISLCSPSGAKNVSGLPVCPAS